MKYVIYVANRLWLIILLYVISILVSATIFSYAENKSFFDGMWWSIITALTIGYGDLYPVTLIGRVSGSIFAHFWIFVIIPMIIGNILTHMLVDKNEFTDGEQRELFDRIKRIESKMDDMRGD